MAEIEIYFIIIVGLACGLLIHNILLSQRIKELQRRYNKVLKQLGRANTTHTKADNRTREQLQQLGLSPSQINQALLSGFVSLDSGKLNKPQNKKIQ